MSRPVLDDDAARLVGDPQEVDVSVRHLAEQLPGDAGVEGQHLALVRPHERADAPATVLAEDGEGSRSRLSEASVGYPGACASPSAVTAAGLARRSAHARRRGPRSRCRALW